MDALIKRQAAGDTVSFNEIGKHALRSKNGMGSYNRVDKINMSNMNFMAPENAGKSFHKHEQIAKPQYDKISIDVEYRTIGSVYCQTKGKGVQSVN